MTVYSGTIPRHTIHKTFEKNWGSVFWMNLCLLVLTIGVVGYLLYASNFVVSQRFSITAKRSQARALSTGLAAQETAVSHSQEMANLLSFVQRNGMVIDKDHDTLFVSADVALSHAPTFQD